MAEEPAEWEPNEPDPELARKYREALKTPVRAHLLGLGDWAVGLRGLMYQHRLRELLLFLWYGHHHPSHGGKRGSRRIPMNEKEIEELAAAWADRIARLTTATLLKATLIRMRRRLEAEQRA